MHISISHVLHPSRRPDTTGRHLSGNRPQLHSCNSAVFGLPAVTLLVTGAHSLHFRSSDETGSINRLKYKISRN
jgi:hypothetical protein